MKNSKELFEELQNNIAISNFEKEKYTLKDKIDWRVYTMKKRIIAISSACFVLISGVVLAFNGENITNYFRGLDKGIDRAAQNGYIEKVDMDSQKQQVEITNNKIINNMYMGIKIDDFIMDDYNLSVKFSLDFDDNINNVVNLDKLHHIELNDLYILDENNIVLYSMFHNRNDFDKMCEKHNLNLKFNEFNSQYLNNGLNGFIINSNKELKQISFQYNMYTDKYPKSKQLDFYFSKISFSEEGNNEQTTLTGDWHIHIDVPKKFYDRSEQYYKVVGDINNKFNIYTAKLTDTGFEFGMTIDDEKAYEFPKEIYEEYSKKRDEITEKYATYSEEGGRIFSYDSIENKKIKELENTSPYKEMLEEYKKQSHPILHGEPDNPKNNNINPYIMNSMGEKFGESFSPSRRCNYNFIANNKFDYYETFTMTKYDATDELTMVINYRGNIEHIKLQLIK